MESQKKYPRAISCEFFPPKTEAGWLSWRTALTELAALKPQYFSCTYGAGGSTQTGTHETVKEIVEKGLEAAPHITCIGSTRTKIRMLLQSYIELGIHRIVALRGDLPAESSRTGDFVYANDLVEFIRHETGDYFRIEVAAYPEFHPESPDPLTDLVNFKRKVEAGANTAITQYFFAADAYCRFVDECEALGIDLPIVPGIMPITNYKQLTRFSDACGAEIPRWIRRRLEGFGDDLDSIRAFGLDVVTELCDRLLAAGAPGLHFYTLNRAGPTSAIWRRLGL
jgi:methylenetetrahydrofolate reductase (NADPH)